MTVGIFLAGFTLRHSCFHKTGCSILKKGILLKLCQRKLLKFSSACRLRTTVAVALVCVLLMLCLLISTFVCTANGESMELRFVTHTISK